MGKQVIFECKCGWSGPGEDLIHNGCVTYGDDWWECPQCRTQDFRTAKPQAASGFEPSNAYKTTGPQRA